MAAATVFRRSILAVRSAGATTSPVHLPKRFLSSTISKPPSLPWFARTGSGPIPTTRSPVPALIRLTPTNHFRVDPVRFLENGSGSDRPPTEMLIVMDKPGGEGATKQQMIDCYIKTLAKVVGSEEEAKKKINSVSCEGYFGFRCEIDEETSNKLESLPGVVLVRPDSEVDAEYSDYGAEPFVNGEIVQCSPELQRRVESGAQDKRKMSEKRNIRDHQRRLLAAKYEVRRKLSKALCKDPNLPSDMRDKHRYKLSKLPRNSSFSRVRNRCVFTGRPRSVYKTFRISRIVFRSLASQGSLMGIKKSSW